MQSPNLKCQPMQPLAAEKAQERGTKEIAAPTNINHQNHQRINPTIMGQTYLSAHQSNGLALDTNTTSICQDAQPQSAEAVQLRGQGHKSDAFNQMILVLAGG